MSDPYVGEVRIWPGNFAPAGWAFCNGQALPISEYDTLFNLIGTTYGGDGVQTFNLPDLQSRVPVHMGTQAGGSTYIIGETAGVEQVTLTSNQIASHSHSVLTVAQGGNANTPSSNVFLSDESSGNPSSGASTYAPFNAANQMALANNTIGPTGGSQPHSNVQPYLGLNFIISLYGIFPHQ